MQFPFFHPPAEPPAEPPAAELTAETQAQKQDLGMSRVQRMKFLKQQLESDLSKEHAQQESDTSLPAHPGSEAALAGPAPPTSEHKQMPQSEKEGSAEIEFAQSLAASSVKKPFAFALKNPVNMCVTKQFF